MSIYIWWQQNCKQVASVLPNPRKQMLMVLILETVRQSYLQQNFLYTHFLHRYTHTETLAHFRRLKLVDNKSKVKPNCPLHKHSAWLNLSSQIWLNPVKHWQPPEICKSLEVLQYRLLKLRATGQHLLMSCIRKAHIICCISQKQKAVSDLPNTNLKPVPAFS